MFTLGFYHSLVSHSTEVRKQRALMEELMLSVMREADPPVLLPPNLQVAELARRYRSEPNNLFGGSRVASLYILPTFPILAAGRCLRLIPELASQLF